MISKAGMKDRGEGLEPAFEAELGDVVGAKAEPSIEFRGALSVVEVEAMDVPAPSRDWPAAFRLVERAAGIIQDYEKKFVAIEQDARTFIQRVNEEQVRHTRSIEALEQRLANAEKRANEAETALKTAKLAIWETRIENRDYQKRLEEAENELRNSNSYIKRVEDLLGGL